MEIPTMLRLEHSLGSASGSTAESSQATQPNEIYLIDLNGMCFFCLKKEVDFSLSDDDDDDKLKRFEQCWAYIKPRRWDAPNAVFVVRGEENVDGEDTTTEICSKIPPMCIACSFDLDRILQCHEEILELQRRQEAVKSKLSCTLKSIQGKMSSSATGLSKKAKSSGLQTDTVNYLKSLRKCLPNYVEERTSSHEEDDLSAKVEVKIEVEESNSTNVLVSSENFPSFGVNAESKCATLVAAKITGGNGDRDPLEPAPGPSAIKSSCGRYMVRSDNPKFVLQSQEIRNVGIRKHEQHNRKRQRANEPPFKPVDPFFLMDNKCEICGKVLPRSNMYDHMYKHVGNLAYRCPVTKCGQTFASRYSCYCTKRQTHRLECPVEKRCDACGKDFEKLMVLGNHLKREHETLQKNFNCPITNCEESFTVKQTMELHMRKHFYKTMTNKSLQSCSICKEDAGKVCNFTPEKLEVHLKESHDINEVVRCNRCPCVFPDKEGFVDHIVKHIKEGGVSCDMCSLGDTFMQGHVLRRHYFNEHQIGRQYLCEHCDTICFSLASLKLHSHEQHEDKPRKIGKFSCVACQPEVVFTSASSLESHNIRMHGAAELKCKFCAKTFTVRNKLAQHEKYDHLGAKRPTFTCLTCGKIFHNGTYLKIHAKRHSLERAFNCSECEKVFKTQPSLRVHVNVEHRGIRNVCDVCGNGFRGAKVLKDHMRIHSEERPFACGLCGHRFRFKSALYNHNRSHRRKGDGFVPKKTFDRTPK